MLRVEIYETGRDGNQRMIGEVRLVDGKIVPSTPEVADIARLHIVIGGPSGREPYIRIDPDKEPHRWLENLHREYSGSYLRASKLKE